jgi:hypothetical protein
MSIILNPVEQFFDLDGSPLDQGYIYLGAINGNPETSPTTVYWDALNTIPVSQPIRTINGFPARNGSPATIYSSTDVSIQVRNKKKLSVFYSATTSITNASQNISNRTSNVLINQGDIGKTILASGTFTQTFDASVALGAGWSITYVNIGTGVITFNPNLAELIDGYITVTISPNESCVITCDGIGLKSSAMYSKQSINQTNTTVTTAGTAPNYTVTPNYLFNAYSTNQRLNVTFNANGTTGSNTLNISGLGVKNIKQYDSSGAKVSAVIYAGMISDVVYDGTDILLLQPSGGIPTGTRIAFTGTTAPAGYLACPIAQTNISRTTYPALHALYASQAYPWGNGDGSTTFGMPWYPADYAPVQASSNVGTSTLGQIPAHTHSLPNVAVTGAGGIVAYSGFSNGIATITGSAGTGTATLAAGVRELFCVKY